MDTHSLLQKLGFTDYEARAYIGLLGHPSCNGYELAKATGMPRANVYAVLERLAERGAAHRFDTTAGKRYEAVKPAQLIAQLDQHHRQTLNAASNALRAIESTEDTAPVFNIQGRDALLEQARTAINGSETELLIALQPPEAAALAEPLRAARQRGIAITTLCMEACENECGGCQGQIHRYNLAPPDGTRWVLLVCDSLHALAGEITATGASAILTDHPLVSELVAAYVRQSLALAIVASDLGNRFTGLLSEQARAVLDGLGDGESFLEHLKQITYQGGQHI